MEARIAVDGRTVDVESLWDWLRHEPELRGRLHIGTAPAPEGVMGASGELVVALATSAGPATVVLARALSVWLVQRRSDVTVTVTGPDGRQVSMSAQRVADPEPLLRAVLEPARSDTDAVTTDQDD